MQLQTKTVQTMSSREIAELTKKRHDHVLRDIENMLQELDLTSPQFWGELPDSYNRPQRVAYLPKDLSITLVTGYNVRMRHAIIQRWRELEAQVLPDLSTDEGKLLMINELATKQLELISQNKLQAVQLAQAAPKVVYADAMTNADGSVLVRDAAKTIGVPVRKLEKALRDKRVILADNAPAAKYVAQGYFVESLGHYETNTRGRQISRTTRVTGLGLEFLRRFVQRHAPLFERKAAA